MNTQLVFHNTSVVRQYDWTRIRLAPRSEYFTDEVDTWVSAGLLTKDELQKQTERGVGVVIRSRSSLEE